MRLEKVNNSTPLNRHQEDAVAHTEGALLVLAGAGTGKTKVLTERVFNILQKGLARPWEILTVTFTNKAATEMRERIERRVGGSVDDLWLGTFHSLCLRMLRRYAEVIDFSPGFTILDYDDQQRLLKQILQAEDVDIKKYPPRVFLNVISRWKDKALTPEKVSAPKGDLFLKIYGIYQNRLKNLNVMDFGDLILHCLTLFQKAPDILEKYQHQFRYMLVDEYQDTNTAQYIWLRLLAVGSGNICCVGDDDQSIYGWRGAEVENILRFEKDFPGTTVIRLEKNYRSTPQILNAASFLISHNKNRLGKTLWTDDIDGEKVTIRATWDSESETRFIADEIEAYQREKRHLADMAILVRAGFQTRSFEETFLKLGIPYKIVGGLRFYERAEIKDALAYLRVVCQPSDGLAFERILNVPKRGVGQVTVQEIHKLARERDLPFSTASFVYAKEFARPRLAQTFLKFFEQIARWRHLLETQPHAEVAKIILEESGYTDMWRESKTIDAASRLENLKEFVTALEDFESIPALLDHVSLVMENDNKEQANQDRVNIMTLHAAKGLEFPIVFLAGWEEKVFPHPLCLKESGEKGLEEERRLAYVGISRAKEKLIITYSHRRRMPQGWNRAYPSRFIKELPSLSCVHVGAAGIEISGHNIASYDTSFEGWED